MLMMLAFGAGQGQLMLMMLAFGAGFPRGSGS